MDFTPITEFLTLGAITAECLKSGVTSAVGRAFGAGYSKIATRIKNIRTQDELPKNHDLLKALRLAMLRATAYMGHALVDEMNLAAVSAEEQQQVKNFKEELFKWIDREEKNIDTWIQTGWFNPEAYAKVELLLTEADTNDIETIKANLALKSITEWKEELKNGVCPSIDNVLPEMAIQYLDNGWMDNGKHMRWFDITGYWFAQLLKESPLAKDAFQNRLLGEIAVEVGIMHSKIDTLLEGYQNSIRFEEWIEGRWLSVEAESKVFREENRVGHATTHAELAEMKEMLNELLKRDSIIGVKEQELAARYDPQLAHELAYYKQETEQLRKEIQEKNIELEEHKTIREELEQSLSKHKETDALKGQALTAIKENDYPKAKRLLIDATKDSISDAAENFYQLGKVCELNLEYREALHYYELAAKTASHHPQYLYKAGKISRELGYIDNALRYYEEAIQIETITNGSNSSQNATYYNALGLAWYAKGEYDKAIDCYEQALEIDKQYYGESQPYIANVYNNLGLAWYAKGEYDKAIDYYDQALEIDKQYYAESHSQIAIRYSNLGLAWHFKGEYEKAIQYYEQALAIDKQYHGESHPDIAIDYNNLGGAWKYKGECNKAIGYYEQALAIDKQYYGDSHPQIAIRYNNIGMAWKFKGEYNKAIGYYEQALAIDKQYYGESHPDIAIDYNNLAGAWASKREYNRAVEYYEKSLVIMRQFLGEEHPSTKAVKENLEICIAAKNAQGNPNS